MSSFSQPAIGQELRQWPLVHGSFNLVKYCDEIRDKGLLAPTFTSKPTNSRWEDQLLGRDKYVFTAPIRIKNGYGLGELVLIDPLILETPGIRYALYDVVEFIKQVRCFLESDKSKFADFVITPESLQQMLLTEKRRVVDRLEQNIHDPGSFDAIVVDRTLKNFLRSPEFEKYWAAYELNAQSFFDALAQKCAAVNYNLEKFIVRDWKWDYSEEILVPQCVKPDYLFGYWDGRTWFPWNQPKNESTSKRLELCVERLSTLSKMAQ